MTDVKLASRGLPPLPEDKLTGLLASTFPDAEDVVCDTIEDCVRDAPGRISVGTFFSDELDDLLDDGGAYVLVNRVGGNADYPSRAPVDKANVRISVVSTTRRDSWAVINYLRQRFLERSDGFTINGVRVAEIEETSGPVSDRFPDPLRREAMFYFIFHIRRPRR